MNSIGGHNKTTEWLEDNQKFFLPPVCNKMMHNDQLKVFYVGGPNQRKDFHLEEGEELFYMRRGAMSLPVLTQGEIKTVHIKEGDVFLLPGRIPHSPQREEDTHEEGSHEPPRPHSGRDQDCAYQ